jgi:hypothetical protein
MKIGVPYLFPSILVVQIDVANIVIGQRSEKVHDILEASAGLW